MSCKPTLLLVLAGSGLLAACTPGPIGVASLPPESLSLGLAAHWTFDEGGGLSVSDSSGNGRDGTIGGGGGYWIPMPYGRFGGSLYFPGTNSVTVPAFPQATPAFTVSAWVRLSPGDLAMTSSPLEALLSNESTAGGWGLYLQFPTPPATGDPSYVFVYFVGGPQGFARADCDCFAANAWVHLTAVVDADAGHLVLYVGSALKADVPVPAGVFPGQPTLFMGRWPAPVLGPLRSLIGGLDDVAIWTRALAAEEVALLDAAPAPSPF